MRSVELLKKKQFCVNRKKKAFTLIELLVVIAIISLLVSILLPSLKKAKELAISVSCMSNLKNIGNSVCMYVSDYGYLPHVEGADSSGTYTWVRWPFYLLPYVENQGDIFECPGSLTETEKRDIPSAINEDDVIADKSTFECIGYGINYTVYSVDTVGYIGPYPNHRYGFQEISDVEDPAGSLLICDSYGQRMGGVNDGCWSYAVGSNDSVRSISFRHNETDNVLFVDGHVENKDSDYLLSDEAREPGGIWDRR